MLQVSPPEYEPEPEPECTHQINDLINSKNIWSSLKIDHKSLQ